MRTAPLCRVVRYNLLSSVRWWWIVVVALLFSFVGWSNARLLAGGTGSDHGAIGNNVWDAFFLSFSGPNAWDTSFPAALSWLVTHILFFYLTGDLANGELRGRGYAVLPSIGGRLRWWWGKVFTLLIVATTYAVLAMIAVIAGALIALPWSWEGSNLLGVRGTEVASAVAPLIGVTFVLLTSTLFAMSMVQTAVAVVSQGSIYGLTIVSIIALLSWLLGAGNLAIMRWLPGSQSMLLRHTLFDPTVPDFTWKWSLVYNVALLSVVVGFMCWRIRRLDIAGASAATR